VGMESVAVATGALRQVGAGPAETASAGPAETASAGPAETASCRARCGGQRRAGSQLARKWAATKPLRISAEPRCTVIGCRYLPAQSAPQWICSSTTPS